jgi:uncharacterized protein (TIGR02246 family)
MRKVTGLFAAVILVVSATVSAQNTNPDIQKLGDQYQAAFNKGDAKALSQLFAENGMMINAAGQLLKGRAAIEKDGSTAFDGILKGAKLTIHPGSSQSVAGDVALAEGTFEIVGGKAPLKGRYMNTLVRQGGQWRLASVVVVPENPGVSGGK